MNKTILSLALALTGLLCQAYSGQGAGTQTSPYLVTTASQLNEIRNAPSACYKLTTDINLATFINQTWSSQGWEPIATFSGTLDGGGHTLSGLRIARSSTTNVGLIAEATAASVVRNITIASPNVSGGSRTGVVAGRGFGAIYGITVSDATVTGTGVTGGLVGYGGGSLHDVTMTAPVVAGGSGTGGLIGEVYTAATSIFCVSLTDARVSGSGRVGGLVGWQNATGLGISGCRLTSPVVTSTAANVGGLVGYTPNSDAGGILANNTLINASIGSTASDNVGGLVGYGHYYDLTGNIIIGGHVVGGTAVGGLRGKIWNQGANNTVSGNYVSCDVNGTAQVGGLVGAIGATGSLGAVYKHTIADNRYDGCVAASGSYAGGIVGYERNYQTSNSEFNRIDRNVTTGKVSAASYAGGILGYHDRQGDGTTSNVASYAYMAGNVCAADTVRAGNANVKRIQLGNASSTYVGTNRALSTMKLLNGTTAVSAGNDIYNGTAATAAVLRQTSTYSGAGYGSSWTLTAGELPRLATQCAPPVIGSTRGGVITGTATNSGTVYLIHEGQLYTSTVVNGSWKVAIDGMRDNQKLLVSVESDGKLPSPVVVGAVTGSDDYVVPVSHGTVITNMMEATYGELVTISLIPDPGYTLGTFKLTASGSTVPVTKVNEYTYTFTMPASQVNINVTFVAASQSVYGDVNGDGVVDVSDVNALIAVTLGNTPASNYNGRADVNGDGSVDVRDVNEVINIILAIDPSLGEGIQPEPTVTNFIVNGVTFKMVAVEGGTFTMGGTDEQGDDVAQNELPSHQVTLSNYSIGQTEVTQELWKAVMGSNPSKFTGNLQRPVEQVSLNDVRSFISKLNTLTGKTFRLPTEAEWEFAARGGKRTRSYKYAGSNTLADVAWFRDNSYALGSSDPDYGTHAVGSKQANELTLYDMSGNVNEWCEGYYGSYTAAAQTNPTGPSTGSTSPVRGGSYSSVAKNTRTSYRSDSSGSYGYAYIGFRLAM